MTTAKLRVPFTVFCVLSANGLLRADVMVSTSVSLTQLTITPETGLLEFIQPLNSPPGCVSASLCATSFVQALDSLGGFDQNYVVADNSTASATAVTALANATGTASALSRTASAASGVHISGIEASASSAAFGSPASLVGTFEVTTATVVNILATIATDQTLLTDFFGVSAFSEAIFSIQLDNGDIPVFFDNPLTIGPSSSLSAPQNMTLTGATSILQPGTAYSLFIQTDAESSGVNSQVPEPPASFLLLTALGLLSLVRRKISMPRVR